MRDEAPFRLWRVPTSIWVYGFLRAAAFGLPLVSDAGGVGLGLFVVLPLYLFLVRGSVFAWGTLLVLDSLSFALLVALPETIDLPLLLPVLQGGAIVALVVPGTRAYVTRRGAVTSE